MTMIDFADMTTGLQEESGSCIYGSSRSSLHLRADQRAPAHDLSRDHKHAVARVVECRGVFWRACHMRLHKLEDEKIVSIHQRIVVEQTFKAPVTLADERRLDFMSCLGGETELGIGRRRASGVAW